MPVYFIQSDQIHERSVHLDSDLLHHLKNVLRLKRGEFISLVDEQPKCYQARVISAHPQPLSLQIESETLPPESQSPKIRLAFGFLKREKMDWIVQKATELGVSRLSPVITERTIIRPQDKRISHQLGRWKKIATEAAQQSCRWDIPTIDPPIDLKSLFTDTTTSGFQFIFSEQLPAASCKKQIQEGLAGTKNHGTILIGPEGGWASTELLEAERAGFASLSLGARILRTETAALAALSILQYEINNGNYHPTSL